MLSFRNYERELRDLNGSLCIFHLSRLGVVSLALRHLFTKHTIITEHDFVKAGKSYTEIERKDWRMHDHYVLYAPAFHLRYKFKRDRNLYTHRLLVCASGQSTILLNQLQQQT